MPADFPSSPTLNQTYTFGGRTWTWNGTGWQLVANSTDTLTLTDGLVVPLASASAPSVRFSGDTNTGLYSPGADQVAISTGGTGRLFVDASGGVSIGTGVLSGSSALRISTVGNPGAISLGRQGGAFGSGQEGGKIEFGFNAAGEQYGAAISQINDSGSNWGANSPGALIFKTTATTTLVERLRITSAGLVGLGTSSPDALLTVNGIGAFGAGAVGTPSIAATGDLNTGFWFPAADTIAASTGGSERFRCDSSGRLLVGTSASRSIGGADRAVQIEGTSGSNTHLTVTRNSADTAAPLIGLAKTRGASNGSNATVADNDELGTFRFYGADGTSLITGALISAFADGGVGTNDLPTRLIFALTADGASGPTEQWRINNAGTVIYNQPALAAVDTSATLTVANMTAKIITSSTAAAVTMTLPTGTTMDGGFSGLYTNMAFEWYVINTGGTNAVTVAANTAHTLVGSGTVSANNSGKFLSRRTAATTWVTYRLSS